MAESLSSQPVDAPTDADAIARKQFDVSRRGFDQNQVRSYLYSVASTIRAGERREAELRDRVAAAVRRAHEAEKLDDNVLTERLGEETVRVLTTAREAAEAKVNQAEADADEILEAARAEAAVLREQADAVLEERSAEAETAAEAIRDEARAELVKAKELSEAEVESGKQAAEALIAEAQAVREEVLRDMSRRRQQAKAQVERLRAGRDRILGTFDTVQEALDEIRSGVKHSLGEAKTAADIAARRVLEERLPGVDELEAEVETTRMMGMVPATADAEPVAADSGDQPTEALPAVEFESRPVALDPEIRGGKKLRDQPEVSEEALQTIVVGDPEVEAVAAVETVEEREPQESPPEVEAVAAVETVEEPEPQEPPPEALSEPEPADGDPDDAGDLFERLRREQAEAERSAAAEAADLFNEPDPVEADPAESIDEPEPPTAEAAAEAEEPDPVLEALIATAERRLKRVLADDQNRVLAGLRPQGKNRGAPPGQLDVDTQVGLYLEAVSAQLEARAEAGHDIDLDFARKHLADALVVPLRESVETAVESADDPDEKVTSVRAVYRKQKAAMSEIATELIS